MVLKMIANDDGLLTLSCEKANNGKPFETRYFRTVQSAESVVLVPASKVLTTPTGLKKNNIAVLEALLLEQYRTGGASFSQVLDCSDLNKSTLNRNLSTLLGRQLIEKAGTSYKITPKGEEALHAIHDTGSVNAPNAPRTASGDTLNWIVCAVNLDPVPLSSAQFRLVPLSVPLSSAPTGTAEQNGTAPPLDRLFTASESLVPLVPVDSPQNGVCSAPVLAVGSAQFRSATASECGSSAEFRSSSAPVPVASSAVPVVAPLIRGNGTELRNSEPVAPPMSQQRADSTPPTRAIAPDCSWDDRDQHVAEAQQTQTVHVRQCSNEAEERTDRDAVNAERSEQQGTLFDLVSEYFEKSAGASSISNMDIWAILQVHRADLRIENRRVQMEIAVAMEKVGGTKVQARIGGKVKRGWVGVAETPESIKARTLSDGQVLGPQPGGMPSGAEVCTNLGVY